MGHSTQSPGVSASPAGAATAPCGRAAARVAVGIAVVAVGVTAACTSGQEGTPVAVTPTGSVPQQPSAESPPAPPSGPDTEPQTDPTADPDAARTVAQRVVDAFNDRDVELLESTFCTPGQDTAEILESLPETVRYELTGEPEVSGDQATVEFEVTDSDNPDASNSGTMQLRVDGDDWCFDDATPNG